MSNLSTLRVRFLANLKHEKYTSGQEGLRKFHNRCILHAGKEQPKAGLLGQQRGVVILQCLQMAAAQAAKPVVTRRLEPSY